MEFNILSRCINTDCVSFLKQHPTVKANLIIADPPYNYSQEYVGYNDNDLNYARTLKAQLRMFCNSIADGGSIWIFIPDEWVSEIDLFMRHECFFTRRAWIVWYYTFGVNCKDNFTRSHTHILYFTKTEKDYTFHKDAIPSQRQIMGDKRAAPGGRHPDNTWILNPSELLAAQELTNLDVWMQSRICGTFRERQPHSPNQLPLPIVERIIKVATWPGEIVYDPFMGTGTVGVACKKLNRNYIGTDVSSVCTEKSRQRIDQS